MLWGSECPACRTPGPAPCAPCRAALQPVGPVVDVPAGLDACVGLFAHRGAGRQLVLALKYRNRRAALPWLARALAREVATALPGPDRPAVVPVPTTAARQRRRGYDQADLLARRVARELHAPRVALLGRSPGAPQTGKDRGHRLDGPVLAARRRWVGPVVLVDDVLTTGATLAAAARAVRAAGATVVVGAVLSVTPTDAQGGAPGGRQPFRTQQTRGGTQGCCRRDG